MYSKLNVRSASLNADLANHANRCITHALVFAIGERLGRRHRHRVAGVNTHWIEILNRADDDDVVLEIAHHLQLISLPTENRLFDQNFMNRREVETASENLHQLFAVIGDAAARSTERE